MKKKNIYIYNGYLIGNIYQNNNCIFSLIQLSLFCKCINNTFAPEKIIYINYLVKQKIGNNLSRINIGT